MFFYAQAGAEATEAEEMAKEQGLGSGANDLQALIQKRQQSREQQANSFFADLEAKYAQPKKSKSKKGKKWRILVCLFRGNSKKIKVQKGKKYEEHFFFTDLEAKYEQPKIKAKSPKGRKTEDFSGKTLYCVGPSCTWFDGVVWNILIVLQREHLCWILSTSTFDKWRNW